MTLSALLVSVDQASTQLLQKLLEEGSIRFECCADFVSAGIRLVQEITNYTIAWLGSALTGGRGTSKRKKRHGLKPRLQLAIRAVQ